MLNSSQRIFLVLAGVFFTSLLVGDIIGGKLIEVPVLGHDFVLTVGMIPFPITFVLTDILNEFYGQRAARFVTWVGFGLAVLAYGYIFVAGLIPIAPMAQEANWRGVTESSFENVFLGSRRMIAASLCAYLVAQFADIGIFHYLRKLTQGRMLWLRATGSTTLSQLLDTVVINCIAWWGLLPLSEIFNIMVSAYLLKVLVAVGLTPLVYAAHAFLIRRMGVTPSAVGND